MNLANLSSLVRRTLRAVAKVETTVLAHLLVTVEQDGKLRVNYIICAQVSDVGDGYLNCESGRPAYRSLEKIEGSIEN